MELLFKTAIAVAVIVAIIAASFLYYELTSQGRPVTTASQAVALIESDIRQAYPSAQISVLNVSNSTVHSDSWDIVVQVTYNQSTACPSVTTEEFDNVPTAGLLYQPTITAYSQYSGGTCMVNLNTGPTALDYNIVGLPALAIAIPLNHSYAPLVSFVRVNGFANVRASASMVTGTEAGAAYCAASSAGCAPPLELNGSTANFWLINYTSSSTGRTLSVVMDTSDRILLNFTS